MTDRDVIDRVPLGARSHRAGGRTGHLFAFAAALVVAFIGYMPTTPAQFWGAVILLGLFAALRDSRSNVISYAALLGVQTWVPGLSSTVAVRFAVADLLVAPVIARRCWTALSTRRWPRAPFNGLALSLVAVACVAIAVGVWRTGQLTEYAWMNKGGGLLLLLGGVYALFWQLRSLQDIDDLLAAFVLGTSAANLMALGATALATVGVANTLFSVDSGRLYGWMLNPSSYGSLLATAVLIEVARIGRSSAAGSAPSRLRLLNIALLLSSILLTVSRSAWLALAGGASVLAFLEARDGVRDGIRRWRVAAAVTMIVAVLVPLTWAAVAQRQRLGLIARDGTRPDQVQARVADACVARWDQEICETVPAFALDAARTRISQRDPEYAHGAMTNVRGLSDRLSILRAAWEQYTKTSATLLFGIGIGTFLVTSPPAFGVPLIVHNTPAWFLVEMGPAGLAVFLWIVGRMASNLWSCRSAPPAARDLAHGLAAAATAWLVFSMFNEAFYARHFWLLFACSESLRHFRSMHPWNEPATEEVTS